MLQLPTDFHLLPEWDCCGDNRAGELPKKDEMADQEFYHYLNDLQTRPKARRWWPKALVVCAVLGGIYGAVIGSAIATSAGAANVIGAAAGIVALLLAFPGARYGFFFGTLNRVHFGRLFVGSIAAIVGAILGGYLGLLAVTPLGLVILGAVGGWFFMQAILWRFFLRRILGGFVGVVLGAGIGAMIAALQKDQSAALVGIGFGVGIGAVVGPLLFLLFIGTLRSLPRRHDGDRGNVVDATFQREETGQRFT
jgi:hypothetical protein